MQKKINNGFLFREKYVIGYAAAEDDTEFLSHCFVDNGDIDILQNCSDPRFLLMGRTGAGKSALLSQLAGKEGRHIIVLKPEQLAMHWLTNSNILRFVLELGVNLDPFFKLLWWHILLVDIIKEYHGNKIPKQTPFNWIMEILCKTPKQREALNYVRECGDNFWKETDERIKESTHKLESELNNTAKLDLKPIGTELKAGLKLSDEEKHEFINRVQHIVSNTQLQKLEAVADLLNQIVDDPQKPCYIIIDQLDENWVEDKFRYQLIKSLIETAKKLNSQAQNVKVVIALRVDLLERIHRVIKDPGHQLEKYESLYLHLQWSKSRLTELLDRRIDFLVRSQYSDSKKVSHRDLMPKEIRNIKIDDYLYDLTMRRPRDIIQFFNECIKLANGKPILNLDIINQAEFEYSRSRVRALCDEWAADFPFLRSFIDFLKNMPSSFSIGRVDQETCEAFCLEIMIRHEKEDTSTDMLLDLADRVVNKSLQWKDFLSHLFAVFYKIGLVGLRLESYQEPYFSFEGNRNIVSHDITNRTQVFVHKCAWKALSIKPPGKNN